MEIKKDKPLKETSTGIFLFNIISFHGEHSHFLLVEDENFIIINMREPLNYNIKQLLDFLERNTEYAKEDVIFYLNSFIRIDMNNKKKGGVIRTLNTNSLGSA